jgi:putative tributyrin esterase
VTRVIALLGALASVMVLCGCGVARGAPRAEAQAPSAPSPGVHIVTIRSAALRGTERYAVYLPPDYQRAPRRRYPVVYFLHGLPSDAGGFRDPRLSRLGAIAAQRGEPAIIVAPQGARDHDTDPEWHDWGPGRDWETAVAEEVVRDVDARFRTIADRRARAIKGLSAGGYGAMVIGLHHPETFTVIESWSGYFHPTNPQGDGPLDVGDPAADRKADAHALVACIGRQAASGRPAFLGFYVGDRDPYFLPENRQLDGELTAAGVPHLFRVYPGGHDDGFWIQHEEAWLMAGVAHLARTPPRPDNPQPGRVTTLSAGCPLL